MEEQIRPIPTNFFEDWKDREALAESMIPIIGKLYRKNNISTYKKQDNWMKNHE